MTFQRKESQGRYGFGSDDKDTGPNITLGQNRTLMGVPKGPYYTGPALME